MDHPIHFYTLYFARRSERRLSFIMLCYFVWAPTYHTVPNRTSSGSSASPACACFLIFLMQNKPYLSTQQNKMDMATEGLTLVITLPTCASTSPTGL